MFKLDHFVININEDYQCNLKVIEEVRNAGFPYEPKWGKGTKGFKVSNLWIGNEYFEMVNILKSHGGGWKEEWTNRYNNGNRGMICLMLDTDDIDKAYDKLKNENIEVTTPEFLKFKWFFNMFTRTMPWKNSYINFFQGIPLQIGLQQMKDDKSREFMNQYMVPNSRDNNIVSIKKVIIKGPFTKVDIKLIDDVFNEYIVEKDPIMIKLGKEQILIFEESDKYHVDIFTKCNNKIFSGKELTIENVTIYNYV